MAEWLGRWTCNSQVPSSSPTLLPLAGLVLGSPEFKSSATLKQLLRLLLFGILNHVIFHLHYLFHYP